ncbi:MAG: beta-glycosidase [Paludibacteraceae bacterium]|nr:beta-glycosidase [Paludibacteraceae bacterium]
MNKIFLGAFSCLLVACQSHPAIVDWTVSTRDCYFQSVNPSSMSVSETEGKSEEPMTIVVDDTQTAQTIQGFGTCFNELGWASLQQLPEDELNIIFAKLFEPGKGANLNRGRMSMGANDFALDFYSPDETAGDFELKDFSIERDKQNVIPMLHWALRYNPDLYFFVSPWCPPRWMKKYGHYAERAVTEEMAVVQRKMWDRAIELAEQGDPSVAQYNLTGPLAFHSVPEANDAIPGEEGQEGVTSFIMQPEYLDAYARLFGKFVDAYRAEGVNIRMVMPQNEMNSAQNYPSCCWTATDLSIFVGQYLGPEMEKHDVVVYYGTEERANPLLVDTLLQDALSSKYIKGVAFQWAGKDALPVINENYPHLDMVQSEQECGNGKNNWEGAMHSWDLQRHYLSHGVTQYYYWNTALFSDKPSHWGWYQNSLITVNEADNTWTFTPEYYELKHLSHFVLPGARKLELSGTYEDVLGFVNNDGSIVLVAANQTDRDTQVDICLEKKALHIVLTANSINTLVIKK